MAERHPVLRETAVAFVAPLLIVSVVGLVAHRPELQVAALTSIPAASALAALAVAVYLGRVRGGVAGWDRAPLVAALAALGAVAGLAVAAGAAGLAAVLLPTAWSEPVHRLWIDVPLSGAIGAAIATWRLRAEVRAA